MARTPDSRATPGQALEDQADAITDTIRRDTLQWSRRLMRGHPGNERIQTAFVAGLLGGGMDLLVETFGDAAQAARILQTYLDAYMAALEDDAELNDQPQATKESPDED